MRRITMGRLPSIMRLDTTKQRHTHGHTAHGHAIHARGRAEEAVKAHVEEHGKK
jgi:hypothetical protein